MPDSVNMKFDILGPEYRGIADDLHASLRRNRLTSVVRTVGARCSCEPSLAAMTIDRTDRYAGPTRRDRRATPLFERDLQMLLHLDLSLECLTGL